jgi:glucose-6-phosphate dehydrogenase assembly protein OpcA
MEEDMSQNALAAAEIATLRSELARAKPMATTMNLIVWLDNERNHEWVIDRAIKISEKHPSRTIIVDATPGCVGAHVRQFDADNPTHQGSFIELGVAGMVPWEACELATSLTAPEVPTVLVWSADSLGEDTAFRCFLGTSLSTVVVDSSLGIRDTSTIAKLFDFYEEFRGVALRDLAWMRLHHWQDIVAHFFDDPALRDELFSIRKVRIVAGSDAEALYLGGWLGSRLGWSATGHDEFSDRNGGAIALDHERSGQPRRVSSVSLTTDTSVYHGAVDDADPTIVRVWVEGTNAHEARFIPLKPPDTASLIEQAALEGGGTDEIFETALRTAHTLIEGSR